LSSPRPAHAATLTVNTLVDENDGSCGDGDCSLRDAMLLAESQVGTGTIVLNPALDHLPWLDDGLTVIDGTTAPGYAGTPLVAIDGSGMSGVGASARIAWQQQQHCAGHNSLFGLHRD
jgi:CSLREA domain-containing protein